MGQPWGRLYTGTRNHRKIAAIRRKHKDIWTYIYVLLECSFESDDDGKIYVNPDLPYSIEELADEIHFHKSPKILQNLIETAVKVGLFSYENQVPQWLSYSERQFKTDHDGAERVRKHREKHKPVTAEKRFRNVTPKRFCNGPDTDTDTDTDTTPLTPQRGKRSNGKIPFEDIRQSWNHNAPPLLPRAIALNPARKRLMEQAWMDHPELQWFNDFFVDLNLSDHHSGRNDANWKPEIDWILKNRLKLEEKILSVKLSVTPVQTKIRHGPDCPRCHGKQVYQAGKMPDGSPAYKECDYHGAENTT